MTSEQQIHPRERDLSGGTISTIVNSFHSDIDASPTSSSQSLSSSLTQQLQYNFLNKIREVHYVPYNTSNSLTIYSYKLWNKKKRLLVATKENNFKEIYFKQNLSSNEQHGKMYGLEPCVRVHKLQHVLNNKSAQSAQFAYVTTIDVIDMNEYCVFTVSYVLRRKQCQDLYFIHIYCDFETNDFDLLLDCYVEFELETLAHNVTSVVYYDECFNKKNMILVNCNQRKNILFDIDANNCHFNKHENIENFFIEYKPDNLTHNVTSNDMKYIENKTKRLTAIGMQNGYLCVFLVDTVKNEILRNFNFENDSFVTRVQFFTIKTHTNWSKLDLSKTSINLLVLRSLEPIRIFRNLLGNELSEYNDLDQSTNNDLVTSVVIYDILLNGLNAIVLGTFGKCVLIYCYSDYDERYELKREIPFKHSIMGLCVSDMTNNCAKDLCILTLNGVSIWQYDPESIVRLVESRYLNLNDFERDLYINQFKS